MSNTATYSPEDNKLRLYVGRVPRDEYLKLRADGWTSTPKQSCDFVATWTPSRRDTCLEYADIIEDEDQTPEERAADRAERFGEYRDKRTSEATGHADRFDAGPHVHGYQSQARAERSAARHDRIADYACDAWSKAEYWQQRTAGVIRHALYKSTPGVRMGRIKTLEAELRKAQADIEKRKARWADWCKIAAIEDEAKKTAQALHYTGHYDQGWSEYLHPKAAELPEGTYCKTNKVSLYSLLSNERFPITGAEACALFFSNHSEPANDTEWTRHYELRLAYENQMLAAQGGRLEQFEVLPGGKIGGKLVFKVSKSPATGRATSVSLIGPAVGSGWHYKVSNIPGTEFAEYRFDLERLSPGSYTPPTRETLAELAQLKATIKAKSPKAEACPLINPTEAEAERLQAIWNASKRYDDEHKEIEKITQAVYSANSKGAFAKCETVEIVAGGRVRHNTYNTVDLPAVAKVRKHYGRVIVITDKPQKPLPAETWIDPYPAIVQELEAEFDTLIAGIGRAWTDEMTPDEKELLRKGCIVGLCFNASMTQRGLTDAGREWADKVRANKVEAV